jgi:type VI secretion system protein ImpK
MSNQGDGSGFSDRTVMKPRPGAGRAGAGTPSQSPPVMPPPVSQGMPPPQPHVVMPAAAPLEAPVAEFGAAGLDPLVRAAGPLLMLAGRLRNTTDASDIAGLRRQLVADVRGFEERARAAGVATDQIAAARYALCAMLDESILSTPWGARGEWGTQPLLSIFHRETWGGEKFFQLVERTKVEPRQYAGLLEVLYICLSLGFAGKYALDPQGSLARDNLQHELYERLRSLQAAPAQALSQRWVTYHSGSWPRRGLRC